VRFSTVITLVFLLAVSMVVPALAIFRLPLVPNWPYVGWIFLGCVAFAGAMYFRLMRRHLKRPDPISKAWLVRVLPLWFALFSIFLCVVFAILERDACLEFSRGRVIEKYVSRNHGYLSVRVDLGERRIKECEGVSSASWEAAVPGSWVAKRCGSKDITILAAD